MFETGNQIVDIILLVVVGFAMLGFLICLFGYLLKVVYSIAKTIFTFAMIPFMLLFSIFATIIKVIIYIGNLIFSLFSFFISPFTKDSKIDEKISTDQSKSASNKSYHELVLGVEKSDSRADIKRKFREKVLEYHPDHNTSPEAKMKYQDIIEAYENLMNN